MESVFFAVEHSPTLLAIPSLGEGCTQISHGCPGQQRRAPANSMEIKSELAAPGMRNTWAKLVSVKQENML